MSTLSDPGLLQAFDFLKAGNPERALHVLEDALSDDLDNEEITYTIRCASFWNDRFKRIAVLTNPFERGESLIDQWKQFVLFIGDDDSALHEQSMYAVRKGVFSAALECYQSLLREPHSSFKSDAYRRLGLCYKKLGDYETALRFLQDAHAAKNDSASILAEMADCSALCGEERTAKVLFREAFFIDAKSIDVPLLESELFCRLYSRVKMLGYKEPALQEWIPVYGDIFRIFNIKRELRALELGKLKQSIYTLENELKTASSEPSMLIPRLINSYFWLIDHYTAVNDDRSKINEILLKIKLLDADIYSKYSV